MADTLARFLFMARSCGFASNVLYIATGVKNLMFHVKQTGRHGGKRAYVKMFHDFTK